MDAGDNKILIMRNCGREIIRNKKVEKNQIKVLTKLKQSDNINKSSASGTIE